MSGVRDNVVCRLREIREKHSLTQNQVAMKAGMWCHQLQTYERGSHSPSVGRAMRICAALQELTGEGFEVGDVWELV